MHFNHLIFLFCNRALLQLFNNNCCYFFRPIFFTWVRSLQTTLFASRNSKIPPLTGKSLSLHNSHFPRSRICQASQSSGRIAPKPIRAKFQQSIWAQKAQKQQRERKKPNVLMTFLKRSRPSDLRRRPPGKGAQLKAGAEGKGNN
ncbi:hypothetical protein CEXT_199031 [Caerostris extrusa]|uniref:Ribosomal protein S18 n=1 Tax=Caerostris extrusa TaxID=172846 RepID=A0AAV4WRY4_CAEEX|nr:hypothetical protein CEXT_199031 [Caerostris extrusa]